MKPIAILALLASAALAACQPQDPDGKAATPPADAPKVPGRGGAAMDISQPITVLGTEPFWSVVITDGVRLKLSRPDQPDLEALAPGAAIQGGRATWVARNAEGQQITVMLYASECSDGMSDRTYPMAAEVILLNETLRGCAIRTADMRPEGG